VLANAWETRGLSLREIADRAGVSIAAVTRFTRRLSYGGYREFSQALATELGKIVGSAYAIPHPLVDTLTGVGTPGPGDGVGTIFVRVLAMQAKGLQDVRQGLDIDAVTQAAHAMAQADGVLFIGTGSGAAVGELAAYRLKVLGIRAATASDPAVMTAELHLLGRSGVVVAITHQGATRQVNESLERARALGLTTVCVTAVPSSPAARLADVVLATFGEEESLGLGLFTSRVGAAAVLEGLVVAVTWLRRETSLPHAELVLGQRARIVTARKRRRPRDGQAPPPAAPTP
jgi:DNA-binding MurR/RpiR family transcriptional regulator